MKTLYTALIFLLSTTIYAQDFSELFAKLDSSVVTIKVTEYKVANQQLQASNGLGSGVIISEDGLILTAAHVVDFVFE